MKKIYKYIPREDCYYTQRMHVRSVAKFVSDSGTPGTVAHQAPLSMGFSRQEYWSGLPFPSQEIFPTQQSNPHLLFGWRFLYHWDAWDTGPQIKRLW